MVARFSSSPISGEIPFFFEGIAGTDAKARRSKRSRADQQR